MWEEGFVYFGLLIISYLSLPIYGSGFKSLDFDDDNPLGSLKGKIQKVHKRFLFILIVYPV